MKIATYTQLMGLFLFTTSMAFAKAPVKSEPKVEVKSSQTETATFAAGCFWGSEEFFRKIPGVLETKVGYTGGTVLNPKYDDMHDGHTGHAESVEIKFDPSKVSFSTLMDQFYKMHDPTTLNRQGNDTGNQYRSAIFLELAGSGRLPVDRQERAGEDTGQHGPAQGSTSRLTCCQGEI